MSDSPDDHSQKPNGKDRGQIVSFPGQEERERLRREREDVERARREHENAWQKTYHAREKGEKVPFFTGRARNIPPATKYLVLGFVLIHLVTLFLPEAEYEWLMINFSFIPARYTGAMEWSVTSLLSPVTCLFLHYDLMHLAMNSVMMLVLGVFFESTFGARRTLLFFLFCGLSGNLLFFLLNYGEFKPLLGASGGIQGFFAVLLIVNWARMPLPPHLRKKKYAFIMTFWIGLTIILGLILPNTAWEAHLGGLLAGWGALELWKRGKIKV